MRASSSATPLRAARPRCRRAAPRRSCAARAAIPTPDENGYIVTPGGKRFKAPTNAFERYLYRFYFGDGEVKELNPVEKAMKELTAEYADGLAQSWATTHTALRAAGQRSVAVEAAAAAAAPASAPRPTGPLASLLPCAPLLLDVREPEKFSRLHPAGALGVPLYTRLEKPASAIDWLRTVSFAVIGFKPHVRNKSFVEQVSAAVGGNKRAPLFVICASGGTLETAAERKIRAPRIPAPIFGKYGAGSQSLMAIYALRQAGFTNLTHVEGGFSSWAYNGLPVEASP